MLAEVQGWPGAGGAEAVQVVQGECRGGAGYLHRLHLSKHNIRCREVQAHLSCCCCCERFANVVADEVTGQAIALICYFS